MTNIPPAALEAAMRSLSAEFAVSQAVSDQLLVERVLGAVAPYMTWTTNTGLDRLDDMTANLQAHIDQRATELAQPHIDEAGERVAAAEERCRELRDASWSARREHDRRTKALEDRASRAETAIGCAMATVRVNTRSEPATDYARGYQACADHVTRALHNSTDQQEAPRG